ncbi:lyase family protein [Stutzerimonas sp. R75]
MLEPSGSSIMPGKVNPTQCDLLGQIARQLGRVQC